MTRGTTTIRILCLFVLTTGGCVWKSTYDEAVANREGARAELQSAKAEKERLAQQVKTLEPLTQEATKEAESASAALQTAREAAEAEQKLGENRIAKLTSLVNHLTAQQSSLREALKQAKAEGAVLQITADKYRAKLDDVQGFRDPTIPPPLPKAPEPSLAAPAPPPQSPAPVALAPTPATQPTPPPAVTPPLPKEPAGKRSVEPAGEEGFFATLKGWLVSLWHSVFS